MASDSNYGTRHSREGGYLTKRFSASEKSEKRTLK